MPGGADTTEQPDSRCVFQNRRVWSAPPVTRVSGDRGRMACTLRRGVWVHFHFQLTGCLGQGQDGVHPEERGVSSLSLSVTRVSGDRGRMACTLRRGVWVHFHFQLPGCRGQGQNGVHPEERGVSSLSLSVTRLSGNRDRMACTLKREDSVFPFNFGPLKITLPRYIMASFSAFNSS
jgi:hypothetical protein